MGNLVSGFNLISHFSLSIDGSMDQKRYTQEKE
jgi:hypothetical protein